MPPVNDNWADATDLGSADSGSVTGTNVDATLELGEPSNYTSDTAANTVWWKWVAPADGNYSFNTFGSRWSTDSGQVLDTVLEIWEGSSLATLSLDAFSDDVFIGPDYPSLPLNPESGGTTSQATLTAISGTTYYIRIYGFDSTQAGSINLGWSIALPPEIDSLAPRVVEVGDTVRVRGANFVPGSSFDVNGTAVFSESFISSSTYEIGISLGTSGLVNVTSALGSASSPYNLDILPRITLAQHSSPDTIRIDWDCSSGDLASVELQHSLDGGITWVDVASLPTAGIGHADDSGLPLQLILCRLHATFTDGQAGNTTPVAVAYEPAYFVIATSPDGEVWTLRPSALDSFEGGGFPQTIGISIVWAAELGLFVMGSDGDTGRPLIMTSPDGITWTPRLPFDSTLQSINDLDWDGIRFVAVPFGPGGAAPSRILTSIDGITWDEVILPINISPLSVAHSETEWGISVASYGSEIEWLGTIDGDINENDPDFHFRDYTFDGLTGDLLLAWAYADSGAVVSTPDGFTLLESAVAGSVTTYLWSRPVVADASLAVAFPHVDGGATFEVGFLVTQYRDTRGESIEVLGHSLVASDGDATMTAPTFSTAQPPGRMLFWWGSTHAEFDSFTITPGMEEEGVVTGSDAKMEVWDNLDPASAATISPVGGPFTFHGGASLVALGSFSAQESAIDVLFAPEDLSSWRYSRSGLSSAFTASRSAAITLRRGNGLWVIGSFPWDTTSDQDLAKSSDDGNTWGLVYTPFDGPRDAVISDIAWNGVQWVLIGGNGEVGPPHITIVTSEDLETFIAEVSQFDAYDARGSAVAWSPELGKWAAVGNNLTTSNPSLLTSADGHTWIGTTDNVGRFFGDGKESDICWSPELRLFVAVGAWEPGAGITGILGNPLRMGQRRDTRISGHNDAVRSERIYGPGTYA